MKELIVKLPDREYPIFIDKGLIKDGTKVIPYLKGKQVLVVTNDTIAPLYLEKFCSVFSGSDINCESIVLPDGEVYKTVETIGKIYDRLMDLKFDRDCTLIALGGGVIGDMTGFAASTYRRGVPFIQVPTTVLSQVDSSVGGKTGVNHPKGKNMIGAFYQPQSVVIDIDTINTLEPEQVSAGIAEIVKYGLIIDLEFFKWLEDNIEKLVDRDPQALAYAIEVSCQTKANIVAEDEFEHGKRALLNLGHTFGHAIETAAGYGEWLHGEAVSVGMCMAAEMSEMLGWISKDDVDRVYSVLERAKLPIKAPEIMTKEKFLEIMKVDKKVKGGAIRLVLLKEIGNATIESDYPSDIFIRVIEKFCG